MSNSNRVDFYLGTLLKCDLEKINLTGNIEINSPFKKNIYDYPLKNLMVKTDNYGKKLNYIFGDNNINTCPSVLVKTRGRDSINGVILRCLNFNRHWNNYYHKPEESCFDKKNNIIFWRGTTTGEISNPGNRFNLITRYFNKHSKIDVGFSDICQGKNDYSKYVKGKVEISDFLKNKYILSIEGNDKDSGINWKLNSQSVILMPKPRITSWLMETTLIPDFHYILLKDDFSDLEEKYDWCEKHPEECKKIIKNANLFMDEFNNQDREEQIEEEVINKYFEITSKIK